MSTLNEAREMQQLQQAQVPNHFTDSISGKPLTKQLTIGEQQVSIPLASLVSPDLMDIKEMQVSFQVQVRNLHQKFHNSQYSYLATAITGFVKNIFFSLAYYLPNTRLYN